MTDAYLFDAPPQPVVPVEGETRGFPVRRIFCVGRNYAAHAAEMGNEVDREAPFYFTKSTHAICHTGSCIAYPPGTQDCHYEMEFVVAIGAEGFEVPEQAAMDLYATKAQAFRRVLLPLMMPGIISGFLLAFIVSLDDFIITNFVKGAGVETLPTAIFGSVKQGIKPNIMAISTMLLSVSIVMVTISYFVSKSDKTK